MGCVRAAQVTASGSFDGHLAAATAALAGSAASADESREDDEEGEGDSDHGSGGGGGGRKKAKVRHVRHPFSTPCLVAGTVLLRNARLDSQYLSSPEEHTTLFYRVPSYICVNGLVSAGCLSRIRRLDPSV